MFNQQVRQTLRLNSKVRRDDDLTIFEWSGKPRRSKWGRRIDAVCISSVPVEVSLNGIMFPDYLMKIPREFVMGFCGYVPSLDLPIMSPPIIPSFLASWDGWMADWLAAQDGIDPPTGVEWFNVLVRMHPKADWQRGEEGRLIRW